MNSENSKIRLALVADIMQHDVQNEVEKANGFKYDIELDDKLAQTLSECISIGNLETTLSNVELTGFPSFSTHSNLAYNFLSKYFDILCTANNHTLDYSAKGVLSTAAILNKSKIFHTGTIADPLQLFLKGVSVYVQSMTVFSNKHLAPNTRHLLRTVLTMPKPCDIRIAYIHCGEEYSSKLTAEQEYYINLAKNLGYNVICCIHSHVIGDVNELKEGVFITNGLGNFLSMQKNLDRQLGQVVILTYDKKVRTFTNVEYLQIETIIQDGKQRIKLI